ncbi:ATP-grasp domain-containing protein [Pseudoalteromonas maricaloris]|uniref:ATP-grasp domain-containing protein n=1 Tax=Pseudoalteromonas maricaloris TaxID=184924 RepID=A0A8I2H945_9GAMM|nr:ATP-grasp domain-containing protein [Pseudoalteromonas maricaloris]NLR23399.1 ATP-grasp domain-containing protein [Pseudoalteromonas maricaloris]WOX29221.1 ATP-grasp domain-containing protein [Pseudoalteromonas maricaloris]
MSGSKIIGVVAGSSSDAIIDNLHNRGFKVAAVFGPGDHYGLDLPEYKLVEDLSNYKGVIDFFSSLSIDYVIIATGHVLAISLIPKLEGEGILTNLSYEKCKLLKDKAKFKKNLRKFGYLTPNFTLISSKQEALSIRNKVKLPIVVKSNLDATQPVKVHNLLDFDKAVESVLITNTQVLIEEYIDGNDCTVAVVTSGDIVKSLGVTYYSKAKEYKLAGFDGAYSEKMPKDIEDELCHLSEKLVMDFSIPSLIRVDFIIKEERFYILEVNSVIITGYNGSAYPFFKRKGFDVADIMVSACPYLY